MRLLPFRSYNEKDVVNQFALVGTGVAGLLVTINNGNLDDQGDWDFTNYPGAQYFRVSNPNFVTQTNVRQSTSGDTKHNVLGFTLFNVAEFDENGEKYRYYKEKATENSVILSGMTVPVLTRGLLTLGSGAYNGTPTVGAVIIPSNTVAGTIDFTSSSASGLNTQQIIGKVIGTGSLQGGYAMVLFNAGV